MPASLVRSIGIYLIGQMIRLSSNRLGVIIEQTEKLLLAPMVKVFFSIKSNVRIPHEILDLSKPACKDKIVSHKDPAKRGIRDIQELRSGISAAPW